MADLVSTWQGGIEPAIHAHPHLGLMGILFSRCLDLFIGLVNGPAGQVLGSEALSLLRSQVQRFNLWGNGFEAADGGLDEILVDSSHLRKAVTSTLSSVGAALTALMKLFLKLEKADSHAANTRSSGMIEICMHMDTLREHAADVAGDFDLSSEIAEMDLSDSESSSGDESELVEDIRVYVDCLMDLVPAIEHPAKDSHGPEKGLETGNSLGSVTDPAYSYIFNICHNFPSADMDFVRRLGRANWHRHERLREKLASAKPFKRIPDIPDGSMTGTSDERSTLPSSHIRSETTKSSFVDSSLWDAEPQQSQG